MISIDDLVNSKVEEKVGEMKKNSKPVSIDAIIDSKLAEKISESVPALAKAVAEELRNTIKQPETTEDGTQLLTEAQAAEMCGMSTSWLALGRSKEREKYEEGKGRKYIPRPPFVKIGKRVRYPLAGVLEWKRTYSTIERENG